MFKLLLSNTEVFCSFRIVREFQSVPCEGTNAGRNLIFVFVKCHFCELNLFMHKAMFLQLGMQHSRQQSIVSYSRHVKHCN